MRRWQEKQTKESENKENNPKLMRKRMATPLKDIRQEINPKFVLKDSMKETLDGATNI